MPEAVRQPPLEIAILLDAEVALLPWQARIIARLAAEARFRIVGRLAGEPGCPRRRVAPVAAAVGAIDRGLLAPERPLARGVVPQLLEELSFLSADTLGPAAVDVVLRLGKASLDETRLGIARYGEWSLWIDEWGSGDSVAPVTMAKRTSPVWLEVRVRRHDERIASVCRVDYNPKISAARTVAFVREKAALPLLKSLRDLADARSCTTFPLQRVGDDAPLSTGQALRYGGVLVTALGARALQAGLRRVGSVGDHWALRLGHGGIGDFDPSCAAPLQRREVNMADPFLFRHEDMTYVFYEADQGGGNAWISVGLIEDGRLRHVGTALRCAYHVSYPHIFSYRDAIFMIPETQQSRRVEVWRCVKFPLDWELYATGLEGCATADTNFVEIDGRCWLMTNVSDHDVYQEHSSELYLFEVDGPELKWIEPHRSNPVVMGSSVARNAGAIVSHGGALFRPSQINAHGCYGYGLNINRIERFDSTEYRERTVRRLLPDFAAGLAGMHHVSFAAGAFVVDVRRTLPLFPRRSTRRR